MNCNTKRLRALTLMLALLITLSSLFACAPTDDTPPSDAPAADTPAKNEPIDYSSKENWAYFGEGEDKTADLFIIAPTVDTGKNGEMNMSMDNEKVKGNFVGALNMQRGIYEDSATMYSPYYRQMTFPIYADGMSEEEMQPYFDIAYGDVADAFEYYMENINNGRPLIIAGFSQGAQLALALLDEYFENSEYSEVLVAAYCIGWRVTEEYIYLNPHLSVAQGEDDTGVIISFNSEAEGVEESTCVPKGVKTLGINPLNWRTDSTPADKSLNLGACFTNYDAEIESEIPALTGGYLDAERGTLRVTDVVASDYSSSLMPDGVYHLYDFQFFYRNLEHNVGVRLASFLASKQ